VGIRKMTAKGGMGEGAGHYWDCQWGWAPSHTCCFSLALLSKVAMFALFQCFSILQHSRLFIICVCVCVCVCVCEIKGIIGFLSTSWCPGPM
jgi:hypothetical protein